MDGLSWGLAFALAPVGLALQWVSVAMAQALRTYSRSRLEAICLRNGRPERADEIAHDDEATERAAGALSVFCVVVLAVVLGAAVAGSRLNLAGELVAGTGVIVAGLGHVLAGVVGRVYAERVLDALWPLARPMRAVAMPLTFASSIVEKIAYRLAEEPGSVPRPASVEVEIHSSADDEEDVEADLPESTREMLERVVELARSDVSEIMTPRASILTLPASVSARDAARVFRQTGRSRIPLFGENRDDIVGMLYAKDLFSRMIDAEPPTGFSPRNLARAAYFVPDSKSATELLEEFRQRRIQIAIVLDEYGGVAGLVTLEDLVEELVGTIDDEHDIPTPDDLVVPLGGSRYEVDATLSLEDLNERLGLRLPTGGDVQTVGGYAFSILGRLPTPGESFRADGVEFTIVEVVDHAIRRLRLDLQPAGAVSSP